MLPKHDQLWMGSILEGSWDWALWGWTRRVKWPCRVRGRVEVPWSLDDSERHTVEVVPVAVKIVVDCIRFEGFEQQLSEKYTHGRADGVAGNWSSTREKVNKAWISFETPLPSRSGVVAMFGYEWHRNSYYDRCLRLAMVTTVLFPESWQNEFARLLSTVIWGERSLPVAIISMP